MIPAPRYRPTNASPLLLTAAAGLFPPLQRNYFQVAESRPYNEKVDVYSFGIVLWEMSTLKKPFDGMDRNRFFSEVTFLFGQGLLLSISSSLATYARIPSLPGSE